MFDVGLSNLALQKIGADDQIADPDESGFLPRTLRVAFDEVRRIALRELTPTCAKRRIRLPAREITADRPVIGFDNAFPLPGNYLRLLEVLEPSCVRASYRLMGEDVSGFEILADTDGPLGVEVMIDLVEPARWDSLFRDAFADRLGMQIADRVTCDLNRVQMCGARYRAAKAAAGGADSKEQPPTVPEESEWITARWGGC